MKITLIFLSIMVAITTQKFQRQQEILWRWSPYTLQPAFINNYQRVYQNLQEDIQPEYRRFRPTKPAPAIIYSQDDEFSQNLVPSNLQEYVDEDEYPDVQSRVKVYQQRRPVFPKRPVDQRFMLSFIRNFRITTATVTVTSSLTLTTVQSCIAADQFIDDAAKKRACRRKRDLLDSNPEDTQFAIVPTETQRVTPTSLPTLDLIRENRQVSADQFITSSMAVSPNGIPESLSWIKSSSEPRFFNAPITVSTTVTTFSFLSATVTKQVSIGNSLAMLQCLPSGWAVC